MTTCKAGVHLLTSRNLLVSACGNCEEYILDTQTLVDTQVGIAQYHSLGIFVLKIVMCKIFGLKIFIAYKDLTHVSFYYVC